MARNAMSWALPDDESLLDEDLTQSTRCFPDEGQRGGQVTPLIRPSEEHSENESLHGDSATPPTRRTGEHLEDFPAPAGRQTALSADHPVGCTQSPQLPEEFSEGFPVSPARPLDECSQQTTLTIEPSWGDNLPSSIGDFDDASRCFQCGQDLAFYASMDGCDHIMCGSCGEHCCAQMPLECPQCGKSFTTMKLWENSVSATEPLQTYPDPAEKGAEGMDARSIVEQLGLSQSGA